DCQEMVRLGGGKHGVECNLDVAAGAVLEADGAGEARHHFAVDLGFRGTGTNGSPGDEVRNVLRGGHVEEFAGSRQAEIVDLKQERAGEVQAFCDVQAAIEIGIVDQALPADRRARLFEVDTHDDFQTVAQLLAQRHEAVGVVHCGTRIVDGAGTYNNGQAV